MENSSKLAHAFKEWAVICHALAKGEQGLILRKGGIAENNDQFTLEHRRFWLYPTYTHQRPEDLSAEGQKALSDVMAGRPPAGALRLSHWADTTGIYRIRELVPAQMLGHLHWWSDAAVEKRFHYREPGLYLLAVRIYRIPHAHEVPDKPEYEGCRSWVPLDAPLSTEGSTPVMSDRDHHDLQRSLDLLLNPTALA